MRIFLDLAKKPHVKAGYANNKAGLFAPCLVVVQFNLEWRDFVLAQFPPEPEQSEQSGAEKDQSEWLRNL